MLVDTSCKLVREATLQEEILDQEKQGVGAAAIAAALVYERSFLTLYGTQRVIRIDRVDFDGNITRPFPNPKFKSYADYYLKAYGLKLKHISQYFLIHKVRRRKDSP